MMKVTLEPQTRTKTSLQIANRGIICYVIKFTICYIWFEAHSFIKQSAWCGFEKLRGCSQHFRHKFKYLIIKTMDFPNLCSLLSVCNAD